jgi:hypothetical protein
MKETYPPVVKVTRNGLVLGPLLYELGHPNDPFSPSIRHLTSNVLVFEDSTYSSLLLTRRTKGISHAGVLNVSVGGHAIWLTEQGRAATPLETAVSELDEVFYKTQIPTSINLREVTHFPKDLRRNDLELVYLFDGVHRGPFNLHPQECSVAFFANLGDVINDVSRNPGKYVKSAALYLEKYIEAAKTLG